MGAPTCWLSGLLACFLTGCAGPGRPAGRQASRPERGLAVPVPGGGHQLMTARAVEPMFKAAAIIGTRSFTWRFDVPQGTTVSNFWWDLQRSTNLRTWVTIQTNIIAPIDVLITNEMEFFRLRGRL